MPAINDATPIRDIDDIHRGARLKLGLAGIDNVLKYRSKTVSELRALDISDAAIASADKALARFDIFRPDSELRKLYKRPITPDTRFDEIAGLRGGTNIKLAQLRIFTVRDYLEKTDEELLERHVKRKGVGERHLGQSAINRLDDLLKEHGLVRGKTRAHKAAENISGTKARKTGPLPENQYPHLHVPLPIEINPILNSTACYVKLLTEKRCLPESEATLNRIIK